MKYNIEFTNIKHAIKFIEETYLKEFNKEMNEFKIEDYSIFDSKPVSRIEMDRRPELFVFNCISYLKHHLESDIEPICFLEESEKKEVINFVLRLPELANSLSSHKNFVHFASTPAFLSYEFEDGAIQSKAMVAQSYSLGDIDFNRICNHFNEKIIKRNLLLEKGDGFVKSHWKNIMNNNLKFFPYLITPIIAIENNNLKSKIKYILRTSTMPLE